MVCKFDVHKASFVFFEFFLTVFKSAKSCQIPCVFWDIPNLWSPACNSFGCKFNWGFLSRFRNRKFVRLQGVSLSVISPVVSLS